MKVSVCITTFNESKETIKKLLDALNNQTLKPDEIVIVDATPITNLQLTRPASLSIYNQFPNLNLQLITKQRVSRARGRNLAIKKAKNNIIAITDAGCIPDRLWLKKITEPLINNKAPVVAGAYRMVAKNDFQKACSIFLGVDSKNIDTNFMPSARSMALTKTAWKKAGGFPENLNDTAEDTVFNIKLLESGAKFAVAREATVDWLMPDTIFEFAKKIYKYAKGDAVSGIWWHPIKKWKTHNIKVLTIFLRYILFLFVLLQFGYWLFLATIISYVAWSYRKAKRWGIILQFVSDFACIIGFSHGILQTSS